MNYTVTADSQATPAENKAQLESVYRKVSAEGGGTVTLRGVFTTDGTVYIGDNPDTYILTRGEVGAAIKADFSKGPILSAECNTAVVGFTLDGNNVSDGWLHCAAENTRVYAERMYFLRNKSSIGYQTYAVHDGGRGAVSMVAKNCYFGPSGGDDQMAVGARYAGIVENCRFDRTNPGSHFTSGGASQIIARNNQFYHQVKDYSNGGISIEDYSTNYDNVLIEGNTLVNSRISIAARPGGPDVMPDFALFKNVVINHNTLNGFGIWVDGHEGNVKKLDIINNYIKNSVWNGISLKDTAGPSRITGNTIIDSNFSEAPNTNRGLILLESSDNIECIDNDLYMTSNANNHSPFGIRYCSLRNSKVGNNNIHNSTPNPSVVPLRECNRIETVKKVAK